MKIYVASSWRNYLQPTVVDYLRQKGHEVYDFKNPPASTGFSWSQVDPDWKKWNVGKYLKALDHPLSVKGFESDFTGMKWADVCVLVLPCGRSAHTEAGWMQGAGKPVIAFIPELEEAELMYRLFDGIAADLPTLTALLGRLDKPEATVTYSPRTCRVCGCTDGDCQRCIEKMGYACHWVEEDLCSACVGKEL